MTRKHVLEAVDQQLASEPSDTWRIHVFYTPGVGHERDFRQRLQQSGLEWVGSGGDEWARDMNLRGYYDEELIRRTADEAGIEIDDIVAERAPVVGVGSVAGVNTLKSGGSKIGRLKTSRRKR